MTQSYITCSILVSISPLKRARSFIWTKLNSLDRRMICTKFDWNWLADSWEDSFLISGFHFFSITCTWWRDIHFIYSNLNPFPSRMIWSHCFWRKIRYWENLQTGGRTAGDQKSSLEISVNNEHISLIIKLKLRYIFTEKRSVLIGVGTGGSPPPPPTPTFFAKIYIIIYNYRPSPLTFFLQRYLRSHNHKLSPLTPHKYNFGILV
jgi:hypothetical protein